MGKNLNPGSNNLPSPGAAADKASGAIKGLASGAGKGTKNVSLDLSENIPNLFKDVGKNAEKVGINFHVFGLPGLLVQVLREPGRLQLCFLCSCILVASAAMLTRATMPAFISQLPDGPYCPAVRD